MYERKPVVLSFFDYTGEAVRPWAKAGYECHCYDLQHDETSMDGDRIQYHHWDATNYDQTDDIIDDFVERNVVMVFGFPPCTDLASSGALHWAKKRAINPDFQHDAVAMAQAVQHVAWCLHAPYMIENPVGALCTLWRHPDHRFDPCDFGGYLEAGDLHPKWPDLIPAQDAYTKRTCLWTGNGFVMPEKRPVAPVKVTYTKRDGTTTSGSPMWGKLGGKSLRTKNIRSATPRGFALAVFQANSHITPNSMTQEAA